METAAEWVGDPLGGIAALRRQSPAPLAAAAYQQAALRARAARKFSRGGSMWFTAGLLEQASGEEVARWRARRYAGSRWVADLCCGAGGDTLALAAGSQVVAVDEDPLALHLLLANARAAGVSARVHRVVARLPGFVPRAGAAFADPSRRPGGRRTRSLEAMSPPLSALLAVRGANPRLGVKLAPAAAMAELDAALAGTDHEVEAISVGGECRELVAWFGELVTARRRASLLPAGVSLAGSGEEELDIRAPGCYLYEPDAAVIRAHLVAAAAAELGAWGVDPTLAYLSANRRVDSPWAVAYRVEPPRPFSRKALVALLRQRSAADVVLKTRGFAVHPEEVRGWLRPGLQEGHRGVSPVVFLTRISGRPVMFVGERVGAGTEGTGERRDAAGGGDRP
jgi:hypothetical protein